MRLFILVLVSLITSTVLSQINNTPKYYLNGKEFKWNHVFINPKSIKSIDVQKDTNNAEIFIKTSDGKWKYRTLEKFIKTLSNYNQIYDESVIPIFVINGILINDPDSVQIDASYFGEVSISKLSNVKGIPEQSKNLIIVTLKLSKEPIIHIRGDNLPYIDSLKK